MKRNVIFYKTKDNKCPIQDFLDILPGKVAQKVTWIIKLLEDLDIIPATYFKKLVGTKEIWECRIKFGSNSYRILCFFIDKLEIVLTHGFIKKTKKIPKLEIERAESFREDFIRRKKYE
jgi:phage-related protein